MNCYLVLLDCWTRHWYCSIECAGLQKKLLKSSAFSLKFVMNLFSWNRGGIQESFLWFRKAFKMDQYVYEVVAGLANLLDHLG